MGTGIAQVAASAGCVVTVVDQNESALDASRSALEKIFARLVEKKKVAPDEMAAFFKRINFSTDLGSLNSSHLVIEAIVEDLSVKQKVFQALEEIVQPETILVTNTSSLSVTAIAGACNQPQRFLGLHFFNPAPLLPLVEVVPAIDTDTQYVSGMVSLMLEWGKAPVVASDTPGFIVNRIARPFYSESLKMVEEGIATPFQIDRALKTRGGFRMGPFELMDLIGNDINFAVTRSVFESFYFDPRFKPSFLQQRMVEAGRLGRKTGQGYYRYEDHKPVEIGEVAIEPEKEKAIFLRVLVMLINEACDALYYRIATAADIERAMVQGVNYPEGLLQWADNLGLKLVQQCLDQLYQRYREPRYRPHPLLLDRIQQNQPLFKDVTEAVAGIEDLVVN